MTQSELDEAVEIIKEVHPRTLALTVKQMAEISGHHPETIRRWCDDGSIKTRRRKAPREAWRIPIRDAARFMVDGRRTRRAA
ncbi:hypothetical protein YH66_05155 [[Brevibacterium] flavum]|uniref:Helix-turn-helix domain-containing protein n=1 Tax=[Brevibacterium] flavum TaxID=92706 RepID=A0A0F6WQ95_9CORY|nr:MULTISPECIES: helix-turn-helix domain-containing protein [Corynebacterium]AKF26986.1 hypothetical protein YH66_05155 [[Brevibacterium] flavum]ANE07808.1 hypothetical protein A3654_05145 [Corynebacterium glutamicum]AST20224.1 DNA-binding protein [Corynebacterium glutamicum ATCC 14067]KEI22698.1 hypothetical protein KIQ_008985 [Corynebacterium glutamicum ATCC 14067]KIH74243.1 hypothetical protein SD36_05180 [Corynebacterium glutamicum]